MGASRSIGARYSGAATIPLHVALADVILRLFCAFIAGAIIGYNRGEQGKAVGLRTTLLVCLAAAVAMLQLNYLLSLAGRSPDSFVVNDLMRLPLGILTGVGFIGAGAILRRRNIAIGVTTAATLWYVTVVGLCFGGDQIILGWIATSLGCIVLWAMKLLENVMVTEHDAKLTLAVDDSGPAEHEIYAQLRRSGIEILAIDLAVGKNAREYAFRVRQLGRPSRNAVPPVVEELAHRPGVFALHWSRPG